jgi:DnaJ homolog subfamily C member 17
MREERELARKRQNEADLMSTQSDDQDIEPIEEVPALGEPFPLGLLGDVTETISGTLDTTVKLKYTLIAHPELTSPSDCASVLARFGEVDESSIVLSLKPPKKAPTKPPKNGTALVPFKQIGDAFAAICASGRADRGLDGIEISWAGGKEPPILGWLKKQGKLDPAPTLLDATVNRAESPPQGKEHTKGLFETLSDEPVGSFSSFSSFPETFVRGSHI